MNARLRQGKLARRIARAGALVAWLAMAAAGRAAAQEEGASAGSGEAESHRTNSIALFMGATIEDEGTAFTLGLDYERRLSRHFGVGVLFDKAFGASRSFIVAAGFFWHPLRAVRLDVAPGIEVESAGDETPFVLRLGADYDFEINERWSIAPNVNLDFVDGRKVWVLGAELAFSF